MIQRSLLRLLDANANRSLEGVRVCEEIIRFHWDHPALFRRLRALRHEIAATIRQLPATPAELAKARDTRADVGRQAPSSSVTSLEHLLVINLQRGKESLRTLEECARAIAPRHAASFQRLRFRLYEIERAILLQLATLRHP